MREIIDAAALREMLLCANAALEENKQKITAAEETIRKANAERMEKEAAVTRLTQETAP